MREIEFCLMRMDSLNAAFLGKDFEVPEQVGAWGKAFFEILEKSYPKYDNHH